MTKVAKTEDKGSRIIEILLQNMFDSRHVLTHSLVKSKTFFQLC